MYSDKETTAEKGVVYIDDVEVVTQLSREASVGAELSRPNCLSVFPPSQQLTVAVRNYNRAFPRQVTASVSLQKLGGPVVAESKKELSLAPGAEHIFSLNPGQNSQGWFHVVSEIADKSRDREKVRQVEPAILYGFPAESDEELVRLFSDEIALRKLLRTMEVVEVLDWDSWESLKGLFSPWWFEKRLAKWAEHGREVNAILGYTADWASGEGYKAMKEGAYRRWLGAGMQVPEDLQAWEVYVRSASRYFRGRIPKWIVWHIPDRDGPLAVEPAKFGRMLEAACEQVKRYNPKAEVMIGALSLERGVPYLRALLRAKPDLQFDALCLDLSMGNEPPEYGFMLEAVAALRSVLAQAKSKARIVATYMDWQAGEGLALDYHQQAMFLSRGLILSKVCGVYRPYVTFAHSEFKKRGTGLVYREQLRVAGKSSYMIPKPAFLSYLITQTWVEQARWVGQVEIREREPFFTRCYLFENQEKAFAAVWRTMGEAELALPAALEPMSVEDAYGIAAVPRREPGGAVYRLTGLPLFFSFPREQISTWLARLPDCRLQYEDEPESTWRQTVLDAVLPGSAESEKAHAYQADGKRVTLKLPLVGGFVTECDGRYVATQEEFAVDLSGYKGGDLVVVKRIEHTRAGQEMSIALDDKPVGKWVVKNDDPDAAGGFRDVSYILDRSTLGGRGGKRKLTITYGKSGGTSFGYWVHESAHSTYYLSDLDPILAKQTYSVFKRDTNVANRELKILDTTFRKGLGAHAPARVEYLLNGNFKTFEAEVGVDAFGQGRGSVEFEVFVDGQRRYQSSNVLTGFDKPQEVRVDVTGANRLLLVVTDAGDGNDFDFADWGNARLQR